MSFEAYKKELEEGLNGIAKTYGSLGEVLLRAGKDKSLTHDEYQELEAHLIARGLKQADIKAMKKVAAGELDERLFFDGVANSKILTLDDVDQARLVSGEKFGILNGKGHIVYLSWIEMNDDQKNVLLGPKGGKIHEPHEQHAKKDKLITRKQLMGNDGALKGTNVMVVSNPGIDMEIEIRKFAAALQRKGSLDDLIQDLIAYQEELGTKAA